jgi:hypothetical protein
MTMRTTRFTAAAVLVTVMSLAPLPARAGDTGRRVGGVVQESGRTAGHAVRDSVLTFGRTVRDFFTGGPRAAKETWRANAARTKEDARQGGHDVESEANR